VGSGQYRLCYSLVFLPRRGADLRGHGQGLAAAAGRDLFVESALLQTGRKMVVALVIAAVAVIGAMLMWLYVVVSSAVERSESGSSQN